MAGCGLVLSANATSVGRWRCVDLNASSAGEFVADSNQVCGLVLSAVITCMNSSAKLPSSKRSASSTIRWVTPSSCTAFFAIKSSKRPGVATKISTPPRRRSICGLIDTPPKTAAVLGARACWARMALTKPCMTAATWAANSRVGTNTNAPPRWSRPSHQCWNSGSV